MIFLVNLAQMFKKATFVKTMATLLFTLMAAFQARGRACKAWMLPRREAVARQWHQAARRAPRWHCRAWDRASQQQEAAGRAPGRWSPGLPP